VVVWLCCCGVGNRNQAPLAPLSPRHKHKHAHKHSSHLTHLHSPHCLDVLADDRLERPPALLHVAVDAPDEPQIGLGVDEDLDGQLFDQIGVREDEDALLCVWKGEVEGCEAVRLWLMRRPTDEPYRI
jgi:hypothetical protein